MKWEKCKFKVKEVGYVGHLLTQDWLKPDAEKVRAIVEMPMANDVKSLQRFLGIVRYLSKFVPRLDELARCKTFYMQTQFGHGKASSKKLSTALNLPLSLHQRFSITM